MTSQKQSNGDALWDVYIIHSALSFNFGGRKKFVVFDIFIIVGLSALLVSTSRAIPGPLECEASDRLGSTSFLYMVILYTFIRHRGSQVTQKQKIMKKMEFVKYEAPEVEIIEVEVEKGFASSGNVEDPEDGGSI